MKWLKAIVVAGMSIIPLSSAHAIQSDALIEGAKLCTRHLPRFEREYAIPTHLLSAIASTESGRFHEGLGMKLPWPWAINAEGKGYYYDTKEQAIAAVRKLRSRGVRSIDVGCMQVNLNQHPDAFASLDQAFEPEKNIAYAAGFLHSLFEESGSWKKAAGDYHSRTPSRGTEYVGSVYNSWYSIIDKLRAARLHVPESSVAALGELKTGGRAPARAAQVATRVSPHVIHIASADPMAKFNNKSQAAKSKAAPQAKMVQLAANQPVERTRPHMNSIKVTTVPAQDVSPERTRSLIVVKQDMVPADALPEMKAPETKMSEIKLADNTPMQTPMQTPIPQSTSSTPTLTSDPAAAEAALSLASSRRPVMASVSRKTGPSFIFND